MESILYNYYRRRRNTRGDSRVNSAYFHLKYVNVEETILLPSIVFVVRVTKKQDEGSRIVYQQRENREGKGETERLVIFRGNEWREI